jgi:hypothetical protein
MNGNANGNAKRKLADRDDRDDGEAPSGKRSIKIEPDVVKCKWCPLPVHDLGTPCGVTTGPRKSNSQYAKVVKVEHVDAVEPVVAVKPVVKSVKLAKRPKKDAKQEAKQVPNLSWHHGSSQENCVSTDMFQGSPSSPKGGYLREIVGLIRRTSFANEMDAQLDGWACPSPKKETRRISFLPLNTGHQEPDRCLGSSFWSLVVLDLEVDEEFYSLDLPFPVPAITRLDAFLPRTNSLEDLAAIAELASVLEHGRAH